MYYKEQLKSIQNELGELLEDLQQEEKKLPEGSLLIYEKRGKYYYCQRFTRGGNRKKEHRAAITKDRDTVLALVRKKYVGNAIETVKQDMILLEELMDKYHPVGEDSLMETFCRKYPELSRGIYYGKGDPVEWAAAYEQSKDFFPEDLKSVSAQGEEMRSGGEMYISARLDHYGIPYRYEAPLNVPDLPYWPDFTIMRPRDHKIIYWEHFGKVNDYEYVRSNIEKVSRYIDYGIRPWDNFIMTYNNEKGGYNGKLIDAMIECWLL